MIIELIEKKKQMCIRDRQRNDRPLLVGLSTNDFIGISGANLLRYVSRKNIYTCLLYTSRCV